MSATRLRIDGTSCHHCVMAVRQALQAMDGLEVSLVHACSAEIRMAPGAPDPQAVLETIREEGFALRAGPIAADAIA